MESDFALVSSSQGGPGGGDGREAAQQSELTAETETFIV